MMWENYCRQYLGLRLTPHSAAKVEDLNILALKVVSKFSQLTVDDQLWFIKALSDDEQKWFVVFVLRQSLQVPEFLFSHLLRAAVYEIDPSSNRSFIEPSLAVFGWRRVNEHLLFYVEHGSNFEKAGAANAFYWSQISSVSWGDKNFQKMEDISDLSTRSHQIFLKEFVQNPDVEVRRSIITRLNLNQSEYPVETALLVPEAIAIARNHPDDYIRHRLKNQLGQESLLKSLPHREPNAKSTRISFLKKWFS